MDAPAVAVSRDGKKIATAWMDLRAGGNNRRIYWGILPGAESERPLAEIPKGIQGHPSIAMDAAGAVHFAWEDFRGDIQRIHYRRSNGNEVAISPSDVKAGFPSLACGKKVGVAFELGSDVVFASPPD
jgi:hypothetical protein